MLQMAFDHCVIIKNAENMLTLNWVQRIQKKRRCTVHPVGPGNGVEEFYAGYLIDATRRRAELFHAVVRQHPDLTIAQINDLLGTNPHRQPVRLKNMNGMTPEQVEELRAAIKKEFGPPKFGD